MSQPSPSWFEFLKSLCGLNSSPAPRDRRSRRTGTGKRRADLGRSLFGLDWGLSGQHARPWSPPLRAWRRMSFEPLEHRQLLTALSFAATPFAEDPTTKQLVVNYHVTGTLTTDFIITLTKDTPSGTLLLSQHANLSHQTLINGDASFVFTLPFSTADPQTNYKLEVNLDPDNLVSDADPNKSTAFSGIFEQNGIVEIFGPTNPTTTTASISQSMMGTVSVTLNSVLHNYGSATGVHARMQSGVNNISVSNSVHKGVPLWAFGGSFMDSISGGEGNDYIVGGSGQETLNGGKGADTIIAGSGTNAITADHFDSIDFTSWIDGSGDTSVVGDGTTGLHVNLPTGDHLMNVSPATGDMVLDNHAVYSETDVLHFLWYNGVNSLQVTAGSGLDGAWVYPSAGVSTSVDLGGGVQDWLEFDGTGGYDTFAVTNNQVTQNGVSTNYSNVETLSFNGVNGFKTYTVTEPAAGATPLPAQIWITDNTATDTLTVNSVSAAPTIYADRVTLDNGVTINYSGVDSLNLADNAPVDATIGVVSTIALPLPIIHVSGNVNDMLSVNGSAAQAIGVDSSKVTIGATPTSTINYTNLRNVTVTTDGLGGTFTVGANGAIDTLTVDDSAATTPQTIGIDNGKVTVGTNTINYTNVNNLVVLSGSANDTFTITQPAASATPLPPTITLNGGANVTFDTLTVNFVSTTPTMYADHLTLYSGGIINFSSVENVNLVDNSLSGATVDVISTVTLLPNIYVQGKGDRTTALHVDLLTGDHFVQIFASVVVVVNAVEFQPPVITQHIWYSGVHSLQLHTGAGSDVVSVAPPDYANMNLMPSTSIDLGDGTDSLTYYGGGYDRYIVTNNQVTYYQSGSTAFSLGYSHVESLTFHGDYGNPVNYSDYNTLTVTEPAAGATPLPATITYVGGTSTDIVNVNSVSTAPTLHADHLTLDNGVTINYSGVGSLNLVDNAPFDATIGVVSTSALPLPAIHVTGNVFDTLKIQSDPTNGTIDDQEPGTASGSSQFKVDSTNVNVTATGMYLLKMISPTVTLHNAVLSRYYDVAASNSLTVDGSLVVPSGFKPGSQFTLLKNESPTFISDPAFGSSVAVGSRTFNIVNNGGAGHDIVLTDENPTPTTSYVSNNWILAYDADSNNVLSPGDWVENSLEPGSPGYVLASYGLATMDSTGLFTEAFGMITSVDLDWWAGNAITTFPIGLVGAELISNAVDATATYGMVQILDGGSYTDNVNVNKNIALAGAPTITGSLQINYCDADLSTLAAIDGSTTGTVTVNGDLTLTGGASFAVTLGAVSDQYVVNDLSPSANSTISLNDAILDLSSNLPPGGQYTIIKNNTSNPISGTFAGWAEGAVITIGGQAYRITYQGGSNHGDVVLTSGAVVDRHIFYNDSSFDGYGTGANVSDDLAIAPDKVAGLIDPLNSSVPMRFLSYTSYSKGINGIIVDLAGSHPDITADDFVFKVGNDNAPGAWTTAPTPATVTVRAGEGTNGSDRVEIIWTDGAITNKWLQVTVLANQHTWLTAPDVFYYGNLVGDSGKNNDDATAGTTNSIEDAPPSSDSSGVPRTNVYDFNRDGNVDNADRDIVNGNSGTSLTYIRPVGDPTIGRLDVPSSLAVGVPATLTASEIYDPNHVLTSVNFYQDVNQNGVFDNSDVLLATGTAVPGTNQTVYTGTFVPSTESPGIDIMAVGMVGPVPIFTLPAVPRPVLPAPGPVGFGAFFAALPGNVNRTIAVVSPGSADFVQADGPGPLIPLPALVDGQVGIASVSYATAGGIGSSTDTFGVISDASGIETALAYGFVSAGRARTAQMTSTATASGGGYYNNYSLPGNGGVSLNNGSGAGWNQETQFPPSFVLRGFDTNGNPLPIGTPIRVRATMTGLVFASSLTSNGATTNAATAFAFGAAILGGQNLAPAFAAANVFTNLNGAIAIPFGGAPIVVMGQVGQILQINAFATVGTVENPGTYSGVVSAAAAACSVVVQAG